VTTRIWPPPPASANPDQHLLPMLLRIWPMPDDLPHAAGNGDFGRVRSWFDVEGKPALGDLANHFPANNAHYRRDLQSWFGREPAGQQVLDTALAWTVLNHHFEIADFLLGHGADINTNWSSHEPASILHEPVWHKDYEAMQFLIDRGIDMRSSISLEWNGAGLGILRRERRNHGSVAGRGAATARTGIVRRVTRRIHAEPACDFNPRDEHDGADSFSPEAAVRENGRLTERTAFREDRWNPAPGPSGPAHSPGRRRSPALRGKIPGESGRVWQSPPEVENDRRVRR
jgi:hypothetical protein